MSYVLSPEKQIAVLRNLIEGASISSTSRLTGVQRNTVVRVMLRFAEACERFRDREHRDLELPHIQIDELETFCRKKPKNVTGNEPDVEAIGRIWFFVALDEFSRLIPAYRLDTNRDLIAAKALLTDLYNRLRRPRPHASDAHAYKGEQYKPITRISTDALGVYDSAIPDVFGAYAEYGRYNKKESKEKGEPSKLVISGEFKSERITTSLVERNNLTSRTFMRRLMRRTIGFSKKLQNLRAAAAIHVTYYNYCWVIKTFKTTPAVRAGIAQRRWSFNELYYHLRENWADLLLVG